VLGFGRTVRLQFSLCLLLRLSDLADYCGLGLRNPRGIDTAPNGDILIVDKGTQTILALWETTEGKVESVVLAQTAQLNLNHAIKWRNNFLYASSSTTGT
jgi:hypothetical protein